MNRASRTIFSVGAFALLASASIARPALAGPQESDMAAAQAQAALKEALVRQQAESAAAQAQTARLIEAQTARAGAIAREMAERLAQVEVRSAQDGHSRVRIRTPRGIVRSFGLGGGAADRVLAHAEELELTDAQRDQIRAADKQHRRDGIERQAAMDLARLDLDELMDGEEADMDLAAVESKLLEISRLEVADQVADLRLRQSVHAVLTPEQRSELDEMGNVFVFGGDGLRWHEGENLLFDAPGHEMLFELRERMPQIWRYRMEDGKPKGEFFFRHESDDEEQEEEGEGGEQIARRSGTGTSGAVVTG